LPDKVLKKIYRENALKITERKEEIIVDWEKS